MRLSSAVRHSVVNHDFVSIRFRVVVLLGQFVESLLGAVTILGIAHVDPPGDAVTRDSTRRLAGPPAVESDRIDGATGLDQEIDRIGELALAAVGGLDSIPCGLDVFVRDWRLTVLLGQLRADTKQIEYLPRAPHVLGGQRSRFCDRRRITRFFDEDAFRTVCYNRVCLRDVGRTADRPCFDHSRRHPHPTVSSIPREPAG